LGKSLLSRIGVLDPSCLQQVTYDRMEGAVGAIRRTMALNTRVALTHEAIDERLCQARLADSRLPGDVDDAPLTGLGLVPAPQQQIEFLLAAKKRHARIAQRLKAASDRILAQNLRGSSRLAGMLQLSNA